MGIRNTILFLDGAFRDFIPMMILLNFAMLIIFIFANRKSLIEFLMDVDFKIWLALFAVFALGLALRMMFAHRHVLFVDEFMYMEAGKNLLLNHSQGEYVKSIGWPFLLSISFSIFGVSNYTAMYASSIFGALTIIAVFLAAYSMFKNELAGLAAAFLFSLTPLNIFWSGTAVQGPASQFFILLTIFFFMVYYNNRNASALLLVCVCLSFTAQIRPENYCYLLLFFAGLYIYRIKVHRNRLLHLLAPILMLALLAAPNLFSAAGDYLSVNYIESDSRGSLTGVNWSLSNLFHNLIVYGPEIFSGSHQPAMFQLLFAIGLIFMMVVKRRHFFFLAVWFVFLALSYFTSWFQTVGGRTRFFMLMSSVTILVSAFGFHGIYEYARSRSTRTTAAGALVLLTAAYALFSVPCIRSMAKEYTDNYHLLITEAVEKAEKDVPPDCTVIAHEPTILRSTTGLKVMAPGTFLSDGANRSINDNECILFYEDVYCQGWNWDDSFGNCMRITGGYSMEPFLTYSRGKLKFRFWKLISKQAEVDHLAVANTLPHNRGTGVERNPAEYVFYFNKPLNEDDIMRLSFDFSEVPHSGVFSYLNNKLVFEPKCYDSNLKSNTAYRIILTDKRKGKDAGYLQPFELIFRTGNDIRNDGPPAIPPGAKNYNSICK